MGVASDMTVILPRGRGESSARGGLRRWIIGHLALWLSKSPANFGRVGPPDRMDNGEQPSPRRFDPERSRNVLLSVT